jgi:hypothetical protein
MPTGFTGKPAHAFEDVEPATMIVGVGACAHDNCSLGFIREIPVDSLETFVLPRSSDWKTQLHHAPGDAGRTNIAEFPAI